jgi:RNA polymerase sigma-70 factor, ECF subfamily
METTSIGSRPGVQTDEELVAKVLSGRRDAYRRLVVRHEQAVRAVCWSILRDHHAAEDASQNAFLAAYEKLGRLRRPEAFCAWVCRIAKHEAVGLSRRRRRGPASLDELPPVADKSTGGSDVDDELARAIMSLPARQRTLVLMMYFERRTAAEIAHIQGCPVGTVTKLLSRARRRLRKEIEE